LENRITERMLSGMGHAEEVGQALSTNLRKQNRLFQQIAELSQQQLVWLQNAYEENDEGLLDLLAQRQQLMDKVDRLTAVAWAWTEQVFREQVFREKETRSLKRRTFSDSLGYLMREISLGQREYISQLLRQRTELIQTIQQHDDKARQMAEKRLVAIRKNLQDVREKRRTNKAYAGYDLGEDSIFIDYRR
jgi:hypothetical protein